MLNPEMYNSEIPAVIPGEAFLLQRPSIAFQVEMEGFPKLSANGADLFLTTKRLVIVPHAQYRQQKDGLMFNAFEVRLEYLRDENFNQPIFGANYLSGMIKPIQGMNMTHPAKFKIWFMTGGCGRFLPVFFRALSESRIPVAIPLSDHVASGAFTNEFQAIADPSDPSVVYVYKF